jgi:hypothetical protein
MKVSGHLDAPDALSPGKEPPVHIDRLVGRPQSRSGHGAKRKNVCLWLEERLVASQKEVRSMELVS